MEKTKIQMMWEVSREQEEEFIKTIPKIVNGIDTAELFKMIRGCEYRRGKEDANLAKEEVKSKMKTKEEIIDRIRKLRGTSTHGNCCTCQTCRNYHDECTCEEIKNLNWFLGSAGDKENGN